MGMETTGRIHVLMDVKEVGKNNFRIREFVLELADNPRYPQYVLAIFFLVSGRQGAAVSSNKRRVFWLHNSG